MKKILINALIVLGLIALVLAINSGSIVLMGIEENLNPVLKWLAVLVYIALVIIVILWLWKWYQKKVPLDIKNQKIGWKDMGIVFLLYLAGRIVAVVGTVVNQMLSGNAMSMNDQAIFGLLDRMKEGFLPFAFLFLLTISFIAPLIEELVFRGLASKLLFPRGKTWLAGIVTSILFALPHSSNLVEAIMYFGIGGLLYLAYVRRGNIKDSICLHILNNLPPALYLLYLILS
ncbi:CAAX amino terminal protease family protein [Streptococcus varani]|uniref:CAAX amino terminal protease family protein n=1 Tax=Streptococcus varani TaxID=1608583 RepID=A0A0E3WF59_9STRE|nr:type II CAAX endopeptidase family protein [Streptococcus varani]CQR24923.1 CAAX amino terminal protease family protein [Streptococcus varani]